MKSKYFLFLCLLHIVIFSACKKEEENGDDPPDITGKPVAEEASFVYKTNFLASWQTVEKADGYQIDVSKQENFASYVPGFEKKILGNTNRTYVFGLMGSTDYYYRVRIYQGSDENRTFGKFSNIIKVSTSSNDQLPNMDLEVWQDFERYEAPAPMGIWATPNKVADLLVFLDPPPVTVTKTEDAVSGQYAAKITTILPEDFFMMAGTLATGKFEPDLNNPVKSLEQGIPFTSKPTAFRGYYKYLPVDGDSCKLYALLSKWNTTAGKRDTVAWAGLPAMDEYPSEYTAFDFNFEYHLEGIDPDTLIMIMVSSAEGDSFIGGVGSTLYVDDLRLVYE
ncbi:MAG: PCMD domain-containing protein [Bacteroidales bacterium]|nr:PCMD domain-containing protein [Bacteroidales bacterium]MCF8388293.1 PCMD domain-containing protein [Bacteroidales bacterium]MCF8397645.1 PCMD domain-containing protein [Bacteroidales bacterium]